jgi:hypothetical protein
MVSPVNASRQPSRTAAHHSGPERLAKPYSVEDFHLLSFASLSWRSLNLAISSCIPQRVVPPRNLIWALITRILCPRVGGASRFDGRIDGLFADGLPCSNRTYKFALASHRDGTRQRSDVVAVRGGEQVGVQAASRS